MEASESDWKKEVRKRGNEERKNKSNHQPYAKGGNQ